MGVTFCYPFYGPVQRFNPAIPEPLLSRVRAHEQVHAGQCRRDGAVWQTLRRLARGQRLAAEAEAYCGEVRWSVGNGEDEWLAFSRAHDELQEGPWFRRLSSERIDSVLTAYCPDLAAASARRDAERRATREQRRVHPIDPGPSNLR